MTFRIERQGCLPKLSLVCVALVPGRGQLLPLADGASATDTVAASVLRDDEGCHNYAEPFDMTTYAAHVLEP